MASIQSRMINKSLKKMVQGYLLNGLKLEKLRKDDFHDPGPLARRKCRTEEYSDGDVKGTWLYPRSGDYRGAVLFFHGGAYVSGPSLLHWRLVSQICRDSGKRVLMVDYPKAPEHPYPAGLHAMEKAFARLVDEEKHEDIAFVGDSAGGGLALALAMKLRDERKALPGKVILLSPWLNVLMDKETSRRQAPMDNMLAIPGLMEAAELYSGGEDMKNPYISPAFGDLQGLPPLKLMIGTLDLLLPDSRDFRSRAESEGIDLVYEEWEEMFHDWMLNTPYLPEANEAVERIVQWLGGKTE